MGKHIPAHRREYDKKYKAEHKKQYREYRRLRRQRLKDHVRAFKDVPCADCGKRYPYYVMDFDHRADTKKHFEVADFLRSKVVSNFTNLDAEIAKCDVVCANCHRERSHARLLARLAQNR